ncbi:MAG: methyltransferase domain-containing protein, partial [Chthoniobacterales bacterium]
MEASGSVSDPNNWQQRYLTGDVPWDKGAPAPPLTGFLTTDKMNGHVLVPGCGPGHDVRAIAKTGVQVVGLDFAIEAIVIAKSFPAAGTEQYLVGDFFQLPPEQQNAYDWVYEHTCFCAIDPKRRVEYVASAASALKEGGKLLAIFYLDPDYD